MRPKATQGFNAQSFLESSGVARKVVDYARNAVIFAQGDLCDSVMYIQKGAVKLSVLSKTGREAVIAMLGPGDFFGEGCLAGQPVRMGSATAITPSTILLVQKTKMVALLHKQHAFSDRFIAHMPARNARIEEDLIDQLFQFQREAAGRGHAAACALRQARCDASCPTSRGNARNGGTTRSRIGFFMNKFRSSGSSRPMARGSAVHAQRGLPCGAAFGGRC